MRIAFVSFSTCPFGPNDWLFYLAAKELLKNGHSVLIGTYDWGERNADEYKALEKEGAIIHLRKTQCWSSWFLAHLLHKLRNRFSDPNKQWTFLGDFKPDALAFSDSATYHMISSPAFVSTVVNLGVPYLTISQYNDENSTLAEPLYRQARRLFDGARHCVFVSQRNLEVARRQLCLPLENGVVVHNPPRLDTWTPLPYPSGNTRKLAMVARLECAVKGQALVLQVLSGNEWRSRDWELELYGKGPDEAYLRDLIVFLKLSDRVRICGHVNGISKVWERNELLIMGSSGEGKPLALTEAMLCGRAAVVTDVAGNAELIADGVTGFVAESATVTSLRKTMERAWEQRADWQSMGLAAHRAMTQMLSPPPEVELAELITACGHQP